jgi:hypothetical protein
LWIVSQIYLGPVIGQITRVHGVIQRMFGWFLMITLAGLTGQFGRVTAMAVVTSSATRIIRPGPVYSLFVGFGYVLGGLTFDVLYFLSFRKRVRGKTRKLYLIGISAISGIIALIPYVLFKLSSLGFYPFLIWIPLYSITMIRSVTLNVLGTITGITILPRIKVWAYKTKRKN